MTKKEKIKKGYKAQVAELEVKLAKACYEIADLEDAHKRKIKEVREEEHNERVEKLKKMGLIK